MTLRDVLRSAVPRPDMDGAAREHGSRAAGALEAHSACRRQGAAVQDVPVRIHRRIGRRLLVGEGPRRKCGRDDAVEINAAIISVLNTVIIILRVTFVRRISGSRILLLSFVAFPAPKVLDRSDVGISAGDRASSQITLPRRRNTPGAVNAPMSNLYSLS